jgi:hypothetical protein
VEECLSEADWNFLVETIKADADTGVTPEFGYKKVFAKPSDWLRTIAVSTDEYFTYPLLQYVDDQTFWSSDFTPIYVRYVSNDTGLGLDLTRWTPLFSRYVELELAARTAYKITNSSSREEVVEKKRDMARKRAKNEDAMNEANPKFAPPGSWSQSRGGRVGRYDRSPTGGSLTG